MNELACPTCKYVIGHTQDFGKVELLILGDCPTEKWEGHCPKCGKKIYWSISEKMLESLVKRASKAMEEK